MRLPVTFGLSKNKTVSDKHWVSEAAPSAVAQRWPWGSQIAVKEYCEDLFFFSRLVLSSYYEDIPYFKTWSFKGFVII